MYVRPETFGPYYVYIQTQQIILSVGFLSQAISLLYMT